MFYIKKPEHGRGSESAPPVFFHNNRKLAERVFYDLQTRMAPARTSGERQAGRGFEHKTFTKLS